MDICGKSNVGFQKGLIVEDELITNYIKPINKRKEYLEKFREYKLEYKRKYEKAKKMKIIKYQS